MRSLLVICVLAMAAMQTIHTVHADAIGMFVQQSNAPGEAGYFSQPFVGMKLIGGLATLTFFAGDHAYADYVISTNLGGNAQQSAAFDGSIPNSVTVTFTATGTFWIYLSQAGSTSNVDYVQVRIMPPTFYGLITQVYTDPPASWSTGYPPAAAWLESTNPATVTAPDSTSSSSSSSPSSTVAVWLAPLLVGVVMAALTVPVAMLAYKKGKAAGVGMDKEQQQQPMEQIQMQNSV